MAGNSLYRAALNKSMAICARREYCISDIRQKLESWGAGDKDCKKILEILTKEKFIDEERYALSFVKDKFKYNRWGKIKISAGLRQKKISEPIIIKSLGAIDSESYNDLLRSLITSHRKNIRAKNQYDLKGKLMRYGLSKGFESHLLYDLLNEPD